MFALRTFVFCAFCFAHAFQVLAQGNSHAPANIDLRELEKVIDIFDLRDGVLTTEDRYVADLARVNLGNAVRAINVRQRKIAKHEDPGIRYSLAMAKTPDSEILHYVFALHAVDPQLANAVFRAKLLPEFCLFTGDYGTCAASNYALLHRSYHSVGNIRWKNISTPLLAEFSQAAAQSFPLQGSNLGRIKFRTEGKTRQTQRRGAIVHMFRSGQTDYFCRPLFLLEHKRGESSYLAAVRVEYYERPAGMNKLIYIGNDETDASSFDSGFAFKELGLRQLEYDETMEEAETSRNSTAQWATGRASEFSDFLQERIGDKSNG